MPRISEWGRLERRFEREDRGGLPCGTQAEGPQGRSWTLAFPRAADASRVRASRGTATQRHSTFAPNVRHHQPTPQPWRPEDGASRSTRLRAAARPARLPRLTETPRQCGSLRALRADCVHVWRREHCEATHHSTTAARPETCGFCYSALQRQNAYGAWGGGVGTTAAPSPPKPATGLAAAFNVSAGNAGAAAAAGGGSLAQREAEIARREAELARREAALAQIAERAKPSVS